jgi:DNA-binding response OmpR family regulator
MRRDEPSGLVLLVEDNRSLSEMVGEYLESRGFGVDYAGDGVDGFRLATDNSYDAVILDLMLPRMDGLELCRRLRKPFAIQELEARLRALIRRDRRQVSAEVLRIADLVLDTASLRVTRAGTELQLSPIGLRLLTILMRESPRVVTRRDIEREIWGDGLPDSDTLRSHLYNLRKAIDRPFQKPLLHTVQTAGYRIADLEQVPA